MTEQKAVLSLLGGLLLATLAFSQAQERLTVLVTSDRTAAVKMRPTAGKQGLSGHVEGSADLAGGRSALRADLQLSDAEGLADATAGAFLKMGPETTEMIGTVGIPLPDDGTDALDELDVSLESVTEEDRSSTRLELAMAGSADEPVPTVTLDGTTEGSFEAFSGTVDYSVTMPEPRAGPIPVTDLSLTLSEAATGSGGDTTVTTTLDVSVTAPSGSPVARQLKGAPRAEPMMERQLAQLGLQVDKVEVRPVEETDAGVTGGATVVVRDVRGTLAGFIETAGAEMARDTLVDSQALTAALEEMIGARIDQFELSMNVDGRTVSGTVSGEVSRLKAFFDGYLDLLAMAADSAAVRQGAEPGELSPFFTGLQQANVERATRMVRAGMESDMTFEGDGRLELSSTGGTTRLDGGFNLDLDGYRDFAERAEAAGVPMARRALVTGEMHLTDDGRLDGQYYADSDFHLLEYYKAFVLDALARAGGDDEAASIIEETSLEEAAYSLQLEGRELTVRGYSQTTSLTRAGRAVLEAVAPGVEGTPEGAHLDYTFRPDGTGEGEIAFRFTDFMPGRSPAEIRDALGLAEGTEVRTDAAPGAVALASVDRPEVRIPDELARVRSSARERLASGGPGGEGGGGLNWMLIAGGVLVVALVAAGLAAGRSRAA